LHSKEDEFFALKKKAFGSKTKEISLHTSSEHHIIYNQVLTFALPIHTSSKLAPFQRSKHVSEFTGFT